ncbi:MAG TPA: hypothetical protein VFV40_06855 [Nocardioides sp.]|nr:hypothetical protein [Nocardioides sp.]
MTSPHRSRRRLPARVYWFRRTLVLAVAVALVVGVAQLLELSPGGQGGGVAASPVGSDTSPGAASATSSAPAVDDARRPTEESTRPGKRRSGRTRTPLPEPTGPCEPSDVVVTPEVEGAAHAGSPVSIRLDVTTRETPACTYRVSPRTVAVKLVSGSDRIWSSQDCPAAVPEVDVIARTEVAGTAVVEWHGQRSDSGCTRTTPWALAGWYHVQAAAFGSEPTDVLFELLPAVAPTITPEPEPARKREKGRAGSQEG